jgi:anti-anti-sigma regulatory factor
MSNQVYIIKASANMDLKGVSLSADIKKFEESSMSCLGIDLSALSVLYSAHIGILIGGIKSAKKKGGIAVLLVKNDMLFKLLTSLNLHRTSEIVRDEEHFHRLLQEKTDAASAGGGAPHTPEPQLSAAGIPPKTAVPGSAGQTTTQAPPAKTNKTTVLLSVILALVVVVAAAVIALLSIGRQGIMTENQKQAIIIGYLQNQLDTLKTQVGQYKDDLKLIQEMGDMSASPAASPESIPKQSAPDSKKNGER